MVDISFNNDNIFEEEFSTFFSKLKNKIDSYNNLINEFNNNITFIENEIIGENIVNNSLSTLENKVYLILSEKYSNNLIKASYNYYKNHLNNTLENILKDISKKWINSFEILRKNVSDNINNFNHYEYEFYYMAKIYEGIFSQNLTYNFYDSIIRHQKSEFNYTISYYYNFLLHNITSVYKYILNQIPNNQEGFNNIVLLRQKKIEEQFNHLLKLIKEI